MGSGLGPGIFENGFALDHSVSSGATTEVAGLTVSFEVML